MNDEQTIKEYVTYFRLLCPVNNLVLANKYLQVDDMVQYLSDDFPIKDIVKIEWTLDDNQNGHISLETKHAFTDSELKKISKWVCGQCSDGLGEGFEQQAFAVMIGNEEDEDVWNDAGFDWETNEYLFEEKK